MCGHEEDGAGVPDRPEWKACRSKIAEPEPQCDSCGEPLEVTRYPASAVKGYLPVPASVELNNEAIVTIGGGYGSFTDDLVEGPFVYILCEKCAYRLATEFNFTAVLQHHHGSTICRWCPDRHPHEDIHNNPLPIASAGEEGGGWPMKSTTCRVCNP